ncbi:MAG TPA: YaaL family protein [Sporosarcina sp.]|nr:YaaL family protein [Sporosarcina sp.]
MFGRKRKLKKEFDEKLYSLMLATKEDWEKAKSVEGLLRDYDEEVIVSRKIAESKYFYLFKEAKARQLWNDGPK